MGVKDGCLGGLTPVCNECGAAENYEISHEDYNERVWYWEQWTCPDCQAFNQKRGRIVKVYGNN